MKTKLLNLNSVHLKFDDINKGQFEGYASTFGNIDAYGDTIEKGAYEETISERDRPILMYYNHDPNVIIGKWLEFREDEQGLYVKGELTPGHSLATDVYASMKHGTLSGLSIGFRIPEGGEGKDESGKIRVLKKIDLFEVSVVTTPADNHARVDMTSVKSDINNLKTIRDFEKFLRDAGVSKTDSVTLVSRLREAFKRDALDEPRDVTSEIVNLIKDL